VYTPFWSLEMVEKTLHVCRYPQQWQFKKIGKFLLI
jgi:hypothetical protein